MLNFSNERTITKELDQADVDSARQMLDEIGSRLSDVFGADAVVWVEGPTEVECFPILLKAEGKQMSPGVAIAPLRSTGDLEGKHAEACADIYRNLSSAGSILPVNVAISLDGDKRGNARVASLEMVFGKIIRFLPRQMYECYLLQPEALASLLNALPTFTGAPTTSEAIENWMHAEGNKTKYGATAVTPMSAEWLSRVNAARLLDDLFQSLSGAKEIYRKTTHSVWLTRWLVENDKACLNELLTYVSELIPSEVRL
jgi:hypothetical protein